MRVQANSSIGRKFSTGLLLALAAGLISIVVSAETGADGARRAERIARSGPERVPLLELYSSEGCDSCPPADAWFSRLKNNSGLWKRFVPLAFQVDYWDSLGWKDQLAKHEFADRQRAYARELASQQIYTPQLISDGRDWAGWRKGDGPQDFPAGSGAGILEIVRSAPRSFKVTFSSSGGAQPTNLSLHFALLGIGVTHRVTSGENRGRELKHDFIVLDLKTRAGRSKNGVTEAEFDAGTIDGVGGGAVAAWVTEPGELRALQATGAYLSN